MTSPEGAGRALRVAVLGTGLVGTSIALAGTAAGMAVTGWDPDGSVLDRAVELSGAHRAGSAEEAAGAADAVFCGAFR